MGFFSAILCPLSFAKSYIRTSISSLLGKKIEYQNLTVKQWAIDNFGKYLYLNFFKPYTEQFWKFKTSDLSYRVIPSSKKLNFAKTLKHLLINKYLELSKREPGKLSLVQREHLPCYYPKKGYGEIANRISEQIKNNGGEIHISHEVDKIIVNSNNFFDVKPKIKLFPLILSYLLYR
jgi:protoporphyrinogen oxidase